MKILVTGGAGFIGSNFIRYWLNKYPRDKIVNLDKLTYAGHLSSTKDFSQHDNYKFIKGDIVNPKTVHAAARGVDLIINFAAESHVDRSIVKPSTFVITNVLGTQVLLDAALKNKVKRFHHVSTDEVFGELPLNSKKKFDEETSYDPRSPYAASKAASDHLVYSYHATYGLNVTITNTSNNYGPFQDPEKFIPRSITNLIDGIPIKIYGDGKHVRDWLYVEDHVRAIDVVIRKGESGQTYLVGAGGADIKNLDVAKRLIRLLGLDAEKYIKFVKDRRGHDRRYAVDSKKIEKQLGWRPKYSFDDALSQTVKWYADNRWWWRPLKKQAEKLYQITPRK
jgi:dTDP-glucose 4,6-dehydratase